MDMNEPTIGRTMSGAVRNDVSIQVNQHLTADIIAISNKDYHEVFRITYDGRIFWNGREVETDDQLRSAMLDVRDCLMSWRV